MKSGVIFTLCWLPQHTRSPSFEAQTAFSTRAGIKHKLAPDTVFVVFGTGLGPATLQSATASPSYPPSLSGTSIKFTPAAGGNAVTADMVYTLATQVAGVLPSSIAPGSYSRHP